MSLSADFPAMRPTLLLNFARARQLDPRITFTRASTATYFDSSGVLQTAVAGQPRFDFNPTTLESLGLLIEEQRTNSIRNNTMQGAVAGTPGTSPTNWAIGAIGLSSTIVGTGTENGITYVDIRVFGTTTSQFGSILFETTTGIVASASQSWTNSIYLKLVAGTVNGLSQVGVGTYYYNSTPTFLTNSTAQVTLTSTLTRYTLTATTPATTAYIRPLFYFNGANASGDAVDFTLRIGLPQLELGAFATSVIPTTTAAATRNADAATMTGTDFSSWFNQSVSTFYAEYSIDATSTSTQASYVWGIRNTATASFDGYGVRSVRSNINTPTLVGRSGATTPSLNSNFGAVVADQLLKTAAVIDANLTLSANSGLVSATNPVFGLDTQNQLLIGTADAGGTAPYQLNGHIRKIAYYPTRLSDAQLQALTS